MIKTFIMVLLQLAVLNHLGEKSFSEPPFALLCWPRPTLHVTCLQASASVCNINAMYLTWKRLDNAEITPV